MTSRQLVAISYNLPPLSPFLYDYFLYNRSRRDSITRLSLSWSQISKRYLTYISYIHDSHHQLNKDKIKSTPNLPLSNLHLNSSTTANTPNPTQPTPPKWTTPPQQQQQPTKPSPPSSKPKPKPNPPPPQPPTTKRSTPSSFKSHRAHSQPTPSSPLSSTPPPAQSAMPAAATPSPRPSRATASLRQAAPWAASRANICARPPRVRRIQMPKPY